MDRLLNIGFELVGQWHIDGDRLRAQLDRHAMHEHVIYAFVIDQEVKYVGKTLQCLHKRFSGYRNPADDQSTNIANNRRIREQLAAAKPVEIYALPDRSLLRVGEFHLNLAAGLEDDIIRVLRPEWNGGAAARAASTRPIAVPLVKAAPNARHSFPLILRETYFKHGFFNVGVAAQHLLGADGSAIEVYLGDATDPSLRGVIDRRANLNHTPRIRCGRVLRDWFKMNSSLMAKVSVDVLTPNCLRIRSGAPIQ